jgi:hypothetical protein
VLLSQRAGSKGKEKYDDLWSSILGPLVRERPESGVAPIFFSGLRVSKVQYGYGADAFQSLLSALSGIYQVLGKSKRKLSWGLANSGLTGFSPIVPFFMGTRFFRKVERMVEEQIREFAGATKQASKRRRVGRKP